MAIKYAPIAADPHAMLEDMSAADLTTLIKAAESKREAKIAEAKRDLVDEMRSRAEQLGIALEDLLPRGRESADPQPAERAKSSRVPSSETHRLPSGVTKKGRGKASRAYVAELEQLKAEGRSEDEFLIEKTMR